MSERTGPLADVRVIDVTQALAGPFGTALLADLGADVIKVEPPRGDLSRPMAPLPKQFAAPGSSKSGGSDYSGYFASINRNKRSVVLDLKLAEGRARFLELVDTADALVENSRAGVMDRLGLGYEVLAARNPKLVYAAIRGFGDPRTGESPYAQWPAFDIVAQSMGGLVGITGPEDGAGMPCGASVGDIFPGTLAALGVVSAIVSARSTGKGQFVDVCMVDAILSLSETVVINKTMTGAVLGPRGSGHPQLCPFGVFEAKDGGVAIAAPTDNHWAELCTILGRTRDNRRRVTNRAFVIDMVQKWTRARTKHEILLALGGKVPVGPVNTADDVFVDPHFEARNMLVDVEIPGANDKAKLVGPPIKFTATPAAIYRRAPPRGAPPAGDVAGVAPRNRKHDEQESTAIGGAQPRSGEHRTLSSDEGCGRSVLASEASERSGERPMRQHEKDTA
jgi:crotonobetainyl-CoA:carnitine CoA-transferase CaiB-like acyl-CoA transferase